MSRIKKMQDMISHPINGKLFEKLTSLEKLELLEFIATREGLDDNAYCYQANRWYLDSPNKPKHLTDMWSIVIQCK